MEPTYFTYLINCTQYLPIIDKTNPVAINDTKLCCSSDFSDPETPHLAPEQHHLDTKPPTQISASALGVPSPYFPFGWWLYIAVSGRSLARQGFPCHATLSKHSPIKPVMLLPFMTVFLCSTLTSPNLPELSESRLFFNCICAILFRRNVFPKSYQ